MRIRSIAIENYRQYKDVCLDLSDERSDLVLIIGSNGTGKTNLLNAIIWCLYGREDYYGRDMESSPLVNQKALDEAEDGQRLSVSVSLDLAFESGIEAQVTRRQDFHKSGRATTLGPIDLAVVELRDRDRGFQRVGNPEHWIERWIPSRLEPYFLFDGERLDKFFLKEDAKRVQDAVLQIAQIDLLARLISHFDTVATTLHSRAGREASTERGEELSATLDARNEKLERTLADIQEHEGQVSECEDGVRKLEAKIGNIAEVMADIRRRQELEVQFANNSDSLEKAWTELEQWAVRSAPPILSYAAMSTLQEAINSARAERRLPPPVAPEILHELLDNKECVCGNSLEVGTVERTRIEDLLEEYSRVSELDDAYLGIESGLRDAISRARSSPEVAAAHLGRIDDWERRQHATEEELELLSAHLAAHEDEKVQQIESQLGAAKAALKRVNRDLAKNEFAAEELRKDIDGIERELMRHAGKTERSKKLAREARFARKCLSVSRQMYKRLTDEVRAQVSSTLQTQFLQMTWKREGVKSVTIDEAYRVSVLNKRGYEILPDLSAGERECLALAFSVALSEVSGYELPMVIDTPMGRLNPDVQNFMAEVLRDSHREGSHTYQLMMLMTDTEYSAAVREILAARSPRVFRLDFDETDTVSTLREVV